MLHMPSHIGRYEIKTLVGTGGMGSLYLARDTNPNTSRLVVVKLLLANLDSGDLRERFAREARALAALNHPNIVDIYESDEFQGFPYIVMEYVRGETLAEKIKRRAPLTLGQKLRLMVELCSGLAHAHEAGIIHRDIKPANLMVDLHGRMKVLDFGIARVSEGLTHAVQVTQLNMRIGTPGYMSPEQIEGAEIDARSDLFAVGTVCYELLSYSEAFSGANTRQIENKVLQSDPAPLRSLVPDLDPEIESIVTRALAKNADDRFQDAASLEQAFERVRWRLGPEAALPPGPRTTPAPVVHSRKTDSRADAAYARSMSFYSEGANEAARRFAIEALAEDPHHEDARALASRLGHKSWAPSSEPTFAAYDHSGPTVLRTGSEPVGTGPGSAPTVLSTATYDAERETRSSGSAIGKRPGKGLQIAALVVGVLVIAGIAGLITYWMWQPGLVLSVSKPEGGTLMSTQGLNCGTGGENCSLEAERGQLIEVRAVADEGYEFEKYTGACAPRGWLQMTEGVTCGATFVRSAAPVDSARTDPTTVVLTVVRPSGGTVTGRGITCGKLGEDCVMEFPKGTRVSLAALADADYTFRGFTGDCAPKTGDVVLNGNARCGAYFAPKRVVERPQTTPTAPPVSTPTRPVDSGTVPTATVDPLAGRTYVPVPDPEPEKPEDPKPPPPSPESIAKEAIEELLENYRKAFEKRDLSAIRRVFPKAPGNFQLAFNQWSSVEYNFTAPSEFLDLNPALGTARVKRPATFEPEYKGPDNGAQKVVNIFTLKRTGDVWAIDSVQVQPQKK